MHGRDAAHDHQTSSLENPPVGPARARLPVAPFAAIWLFAVIWLFAAIGGIATVALAVPPPNARVDGDRRVDAALRDVFFADPDRGWAVGDLGTIVATSDGGNVWLPQASSTSGNLQSVFFSTPERGFAVGGWYESDTGLGRGILLRTRDGGQTWKPLETDLPPLHAIRQLAGGGLIAVGEWSAIHLGHIFLSEDDGLSWRALGGDRIRQTTAASLSPDGLLVADDQGVLFSTTRASVPPEAVATLADVQLLTTAGPHAAAALADRTFAVSRDGGRRWARLELGAGDGGFLPLCGATSAEGSVWFAGAPGTRLWRIDPQGQLSEHETNVDRPLYGLHFHDPHRGWAVGGFGAILATRDGGRTWRVQRGGTERAMLLGVAVDPVELPWPVLASEALEMGHRFTVAVEDPRDGRTAQAAAALGGGEVLGWDSGDVSPDSIAAVIASSAPSVVLLGADLSEADRDRWLSQAVRGGVARVFEVSGESRAELTIHASAVLPVAGVITADLWADALALLDPRHAVPERLFLRRRWDQSRSDRLAGGVSDGLPSSGGRRPIPEGRRRNFQILQARSGESRLVERLIQDARQLDSEPLAQHLSLLVNQTPTENRERLLRKLMHRIETATEHRPSDVRLYLATLAEAARQLPDSGLGRAADLRRNSLLQSSEWAPLVAGARLSRGAAPQGMTEKVAAHSSPFEKYDSRVLPVTATELPGDSPIELPRDLPGKSAEEVPSRLAGEVSGELADEVSGELADQVSDEPAGAVEMIALAGAEDMPWQVHPAVLLWKSARGPEAMSSWDRGAVRRLAEALSAGAWKDLLAPGAEDLLVAVPTVRGGRSERPWLDGRLDDPCWGEFAELPLAADGSQPAVQFAYDAEFVYFALRGSFGDDDRVQPIGQRQRDSGLESEVRAVLEIDVDRDLLTAYELSVDARGHTRDTCGGFTHWQPMWYVATDLQSGVRTIEAAVRRQDLVGLPPVAGDRWRIRARIVAPDDPRQREPIADPSGWKTLVFE